MKKRIFGKNLSRSRTARDALVRSQVRSLVISGKITTTQAKAKVLKSYFEKMMTLAKKETIAARRRVFSKLANDNATTKRIFEIAKASPKSYGFTKLIALPPRKGDMAKIVRVEIIDWFEETKEPKKIKKEVKETKAKEVKVNPEKKNVKKASKK